MTKGDMASLQMLYTGIARVRSSDASRHARVNGTV